MIMKGQYWDHINIHHRIAFKSYSFNLVSRLFEKQIVNVLIEDHRSAPPLNTCDGN